MKMNFRKQVFSIMEFSMIISLELIIMLAFVDKDLINLISFINFRCLNCKVSCLESKLVNTN
jgi:hypothetical protein